MQLQDGELGGDKPVSKSFWQRARLLVTGPPVIQPDDLTQKEAGAEVFRIAWPAVVEMFLVQLCSMVNQMMVGQLGSWASSAVGLTTQPKFILLAVFNALNVGTTALVARCKGQGDMESANKALRQMMVLTLGLSLALSAVGIIFADFLVTVVMGATPGAQDTVEAIKYFNIQMIGFSAVACTMVVTAALRGIGKTKAAMAYNLTSNIVNVIAGYVLINGKWGAPALGVSGASIALVIGQCVSLLIALFIIIRGSGGLTLRITKSVITFKGNIVKRVLNIGTPAMLEQLIMRVGMLLFARIVVSLGTEAYATHTIAMNIQAMSFMVGQGFGIAATSLLGQSLGRKRPDHAKIYVRSSRRFGLYTSVIIGLAFFFLGEFLMTLYSKEAIVISTGGNLLKMMAFLMPIQSSQLILNGALRGAGDTKFMAVMTFLGVLLIRPGMGYVFVHMMNFGVYGAWYALILDQCTRSACALLRFNNNKWQSIEV